jgi:hypothetical protein
MQNVRTDYLVTGNGEVGIAFADMLPGLSDVHITDRDRPSKQGGH